MENNNITYWKGLEDFNPGPEKQAVDKREFAEDLPIDAFLEDIGVRKATPRRDFLKTVGFGLSAATLAACNQAPLHKAIPYLVKPEEITPGIANFYTSNFDGYSILVKTREGRPIKIEGNPACPVAKGSTDALGQAAVLDVYNNQRLKGPMLKGNDTTWDELDHYVSDALKSAAARGGNIRVLNCSMYSPSTAAVLENFKAAWPGVKVVTFDPVSYSAIVQANKNSFDKEVLPSYRFDRADVIVSFGADFLGTWISPVEFTKQYVSGRNALKLEEKKMSRHIQFESGLSMTGSNADIRYTLKPSEEGAALLALYNAVAGSGAAQLTGDSARLAASALPKDAISKTAAALLSAKGRSLLVSGSNDVSVQILVNAINAALGNYGTTIDLDNVSLRHTGNDAEVMDLVNSMTRGEVEVLILYGTNPVYNYAQSIAFREGLKKVKVKVSLAQSLDESAAFCDAVAPDHHFLENWNDAQVRPNLYAIAQPVINPIFDSRAGQQSFLNWAFASQSPHSSTAHPSGNSSDKAEKGNTGFGASATGSDKAAGASAGVQNSTRLPDSAATKDTARIAKSGSAGLGAAAASPASGAVHIPDSALAGNIAASSATMVLSQGQPGHITYSAGGKSSVRPQLWYDFLRNNWEKVIFTQAGLSGDFTQNWENLLKKGFIENAPSASKVYTFTKDLNAVAQNVLHSASLASGKLEISLYQSVGLRDGKHANNAWLLELPDPVTKVTWDNYLAISLHTAHDLGLRDGDFVKIKGTSSQVENKGDFTVPVLIQPGQAYGTASIAVGYGRTAAGKAGNNVGHNVYPFVHFANGSFQYNGPLEISKAEGNQEFARTQDHDTIEGRDMARETILSEYIKNPAAGSGKAEREKEEDKPDVFYDIPKKGHHWGMSIDLNACTGCNACIVACVAENNVAVVGKTEVRRRREMHWIRIDRYYYFNNDDNKAYTKESEIKRLDRDGALEKISNVSVFFQPMLCQQCDHAPCETVCPVLATMHSSEGLNQQVYNRCFGTRYCANNCPYKVRRFNWFKYFDNDQFDFAMNDELGKMVLNPDVVVRSRGVMEKCTFCVQRIQAGKLAAKIEGAPLKDGAIQTACQQTCPANAIVFGDINDAGSEVSKLLKNERTYYVLEELGTQPGIGYLTKVRNRDIDYKEAHPESL